MDIGKFLVGTGRSAQGDGLKQTTTENTAGQPVTGQPVTGEHDKPTALQSVTGRDNISISPIWARVARGINVRDATPREIIALSNALFEADAISYDDHIDLSFQPEVNLDTARASKPFSHGSKDYITLWQDKEQAVIRAGGDRHQIEDTHRIQAILTYIDSLK